MNSLKRFRQFVTETWAELKKTTWPGKKEVYGTTVVVIITVILCAAYLFVADLILRPTLRTIEEFFVKMN